MIKRIDTICLYVSNLEEASAWYQKLQGFKEAFKGEGYRVLSIANSEVPLTLEERKSTCSLESHAYPIFFTDDLEYTYKHLKEQGVKLSDIQKDGVNTYFDFFDLDDNKLQVCYWE